MQPDVSVHQGVGDSKHQQVRTKATTRFAHTLMSLVEASGERDHRPDAVTSSSFAVKPKTLNHGPSEADSNLSPIGAVGPVFHHPSSTKHTNLLTVPKPACLVH
jgi:hypothetical protein